MVRTPRRALGAVAAALLAASTVAAVEVDDNVLQVGEGTLVASTAFTGATEIDFDGRYAYVGQFNGRYDRGALPDQGGIHVFDMVGDDDTPQFSQVGGSKNAETGAAIPALACAGTDNYVRTMDPAVFGGEYVLMSHHSNKCTSQDLARDPNSTGGNGLAVVDVSNPAKPRITDVVGHTSAHTAMPHPTRPFVYILPGGLANGSRTSGNRQTSPTAIIDASNVNDLKFVNSYMHNATGCHDLGFSADGNWAYCAGLGEVQVWDISGDKIKAPQVVNTIVNPAIQFAHNAVISPDGTKLVINDEAFGFHTCEGEAADLYGSLWIYDITVPNLPVLAGRISPPAKSGPPGTLPGWVSSWCAAHNYNFVPNTDIVVSSWFAGGMTAHDISDPLQPKLIAQYQPGEADGKPSVMYSAHYYGGYVAIGDMDRGFQVLDIPALREAEAAGAAAATEAAGVAGVSAALPGLGGATARVDRTADLVPAVLPERPVRPEWQPGGICVLPGRPG
jgi:hypothetical protein